MRPPPHTLPDNPSIVRQCANSSCPKFVSIRGSSIRLNHETADLRQGCSRWIVVSGGDMATFMLLLRHTGDDVRDYTPEELQQMMERYFAWSDQLRREDRNIGGDELKDGGRVIRRQGDQFVVDGPYTETKESVGGYYLIKAADYDDAVAVAKGCPILLYGGIVEVREINDYT